MTAPDPRQDLGTQAVVAGDALTWTVQINNPDGTGTDLTAVGTTWTADLRQSVAAQPEVAFTVDASSAATGTLVLSLTGTVTASMGTSNAQTHWYFDVQATGGTVSPQTVFKGQLVVYKGII